MKKLLLALTMLTAFASGAHALVIENLGVNPTSAQGDFSNSVGGTTFEDQYTFQLVGGPQFVSIASATNVYTSSTSTDFITNFAGQLFQQVGAIDPDGVAGDDIGFGLITAVACPTSPTNCQILAGQRLLNTGNYYLEVTGTGGGTSGYGGNLSTFAVPGPAVGAGLPALLGALGLFGFNFLRRKRGQEATTG